MFTPLSQTTVILTSNIGARHMLDAAAAKGSDAEDAFDRAAERALAELRGQFRPELLNRLDEIVVFKV